MNATLILITKSEARKRYNAGYRIGVANERHELTHEGPCYFPDELPGPSFDDLVSWSTDSRIPSQRAYWYKPVSEFAEGYAGYQDVPQHLAKRA